MSTRSKPLVVISEDDHVGLGLHYAKHLCQVSADARCTVIDVNSSMDAYAETLKGIIDEDELRALLKQQRNDQLTGMIEREHGELAEHCNVKILEGVPFIETIKEALRGNNGVIIKMAQSDISPKERLFGSMDMHLMRKSPLPVLILKPKQTELPRKMLVPIDVTHDPDNQKFNRTIVDLAGFAAERFSSEVHLLAVWRLEGEETMRNSQFLKVKEADIEAMIERIESNTRSSLETFAAYLKGTFSLVSEPQIHLAKGHANIAIPRFAQENDIELIVMGTIGRTGIPGLFIGNTAEAVLSNVDCSVLTTKPVGFITPVA